MKSKLWISMLVVVAIAVACGSSETNDSGTASTVALGNSGVESNAALITVDDLTNAHIDPPATYPNSPSLGGDHYQFWHNCGFYEVELLEGAATHNLEHGVVWITYNDDVSPEDLTILRSLAEDNDRLLISPYDQTEPLILSAWGVQLRGVAQAGDVQVEDFIGTYVDQSKLDEQGASCSGAAGVPPDDVRTLANGDQVPPEWS